MVSIRTTVYLAIACVIPALFPSIVSGQDTTAASVSQLIRKFESAVALIDKEFEKEAESHLKKLEQSLRDQSVSYEEAFIKVRKSLLDDFQNLRRAAKADDNLQLALEIDSKVSHYTELKAEPPITGATLTKEAPGRSSSSHTARLHKQVEELSQQVALITGTELAEFSFVGAANLKPLLPGQQIFSNRDYVWQQFPPRFRGWGFTMHAIKTSRTYSVDVRKPGVIVMFFDSSKDSQDSRALFEGGWTMLNPDVEFEAALVPYQAAFRIFPAGKHDIPLAHPSSGSIVLIPPGSVSKQ